MVDALLLAASATNYGIPAAALIVSAAALLYGVKFGRTGTIASIESAMSDRIDDLVQQLKDAREEGRECKRRCDGLTRENVELMRRLVNLEKNGDH
jgi:flagellar basal body rod protein FlgF